MIDEALPRPSQLSPAAWLMYQGSVAGDYALRTGLASVIAGAQVPSVLRGHWRRERERLEFYAQLPRDAAQVFAPPPKVHVTRTAGRNPGIDGRVELLRFDSPYAALNPALRRDYAKHANNTVARAQHWRHAGAARETLVVVHGFGASPAWFNTLFFSLKEFFADGWDVLLYTLPFHGSRRGPRAPVNGVELMAHGMSHFSEGMIQAIHDLRAFLDHLEAQGAPRTGITGLSLGGYTSALAAAVDDRLAFAVPNAAVTWLPPLLGSWFPANVSSVFLRAMTGVGDDLLERAVAVTSPLTYPPVIAKDRLLIVAGLGDRLAPPEQSVLLWEHWGRPELEWFPGSHVLHFGRGDYFAAMRRVMAPPPPRRTRGGRSAGRPRTGTDG